MADRYWEHTTHLPLKGIGDIDGDGRGDFIASMRIWPEGRSIGSQDLVNIVTVHSGVNGRVIRSHQETEVTLNPRGEQVGIEPLSLGDIDGDGIPDYGAWEDYWGGLTWLYSGRDGSQIARFDIDFGYDLQIRGVRGAGDINRDGVPDLVMGTWTWNHQRNLLYVSGKVRGKTTIRSILPPVIRSLQSFDEYEVRYGGLNPLGDVTGDGVPDLLVREPAKNGNGAVLISGRSGSLVWTREGKPAWLFPDALRGAVSIGDVNGDQMGDIVGLWSLEGTKGNSLLLLSGQDGEVLSTISNNELFGGCKTLVSLGDLNGDGLSEVAVGAMEYSSRVNFRADFGPGEVRVYSIGPGGKLPESNVDLTISRKQDQTILSWPATVAEPHLESSTDLLDWQPVEDLTPANFYKVPASETTGLHYRMRLERSE